MPVTQRSGRLRGKAQVPGQSGLLRSPYMQSPPLSKRTDIQTAPPNQMTAKQTQRSQRPTCNPNTSIVYSLRADSPPIGSLQTILPRSPLLAPPRNRDLPESLEPLGALLGARSLLSFSHSVFTTLLT